MQCPLCKTTVFVSKTLEENLKGNACKNCGGYWISSSVYWDWIKKHGDILEEKPFAEISLQTEDSKQPKLCPDCGRILLSYKKTFEYSENLKATFR